MNKMAKGALATGVGVALLLGGGGTLAVWNDTANATTGSIVAGNLDLVSDTGTWKNAAGATIDLATYKIVPGETLNYTQPLTIVLQGAEIKATLAPVFDSALKNSFNGQLSYSYSIKSEKGRELKDQTLTEKDAGKGTVTASVTFSQNAGNDLRTVAQDISKVQYSLQQTVK